MRGLLNVVMGSFILIGGFLPGSLLAQSIDPVQFIVAPETPGPDELVIIEAQGVGGFLGSATITWQKDGKTEKSGVGERQFSFTTGALGSRTSVRVLIDSPSQGGFERTLVFIPTLTSLVWEADTYTPPLYAGKALYSAGSPLKVVAYPTVVIQGARVSSNSLIFQWQRNGEAVAGASGLGRSIYSFGGDQLQSEERVSVDVYLGSARVGHGEVTIPVSDPLILLYERDPLRGVVYEAALPQAISLLGREIAVQAEPYYFSNISKNAGLLTYSWTLNGADTSGPDTARGILTLRQTGSGAGAAALTVDVQNNGTEQLVQQASAALQIIFGGQQSSLLNSSLGAAAVNVISLLAQVDSATIENNLKTTPIYSTWSPVTGPTAPTGPTSPTSGTNLRYTPLEPLSSFSSTQGDWNLQYYLQTAFRLLISGGALFAVAMLTLSGIRYMLSEVATDKALAVKRIRASIYGLLLLITCWLILNTINPTLLNFNLKLGQVQITGTQPVGNTTGNDPQRQNLEITKRVGDIEYSGFSSLSVAQRAAIMSGLYPGGVECNNWVLCFSHSEFISYDPNNINDPAVKKAIEDYAWGCESLSGNLSLGRVRQINGSFVGASGQTAHVCQLVGTGQ